MSGCWACGSPPDRQHHPTGRGSKNEYLDRNFKAPLCHDDHEHVHDGWRAQGLDEAPERLTRVESVELRLRRTAATFVRCDREHFDPDPTAIAETLLVWADDLATHRSGLDTIHAGWREGDCML